jgi:Tfp pilus assembly protein PilP
MKMKGIIDRFEGKYAVIELQDGQMLNIDKETLPVGSKEGMVIHISENSTIDIAETKKRKEEIEELTKDLWEE